jgi:hypothetical protein
MADWSDTTWEAQRVWVDVFRGYSPARKWRLLGEAFRTAQMLHAAGYRQTHQGALRSAIHSDWLARNYGGRGIPSRLDMAEPLSNLQVLRDVLSVLTRLQIPHALGGSMASSLYGIARLTLDADVAVEPFPDKIHFFVASFGPDDYVRPLAIEDAHRSRSSFNVINAAAGFKVDIFVRPDEPFAQSAMARRQLVSLGDPADEPIALQTAEDVILFKLQWFRLGQEANQQQWKDVLGVLTTRKGQLDESYLLKWAHELKIGDLLRRAKVEATGQVQLP